MDSNVLENVKERVYNTVSDLFDVKMSDAQKFDSAKADFMEVASDIKEGATDALRELLPLGYQGVFDVLDSALPWDELLEHTGELYVEHVYTRIAAGLHGDGAKAAAPGAERTAGRRGGARDRPRRLGRRARGAPARPRRRFAPAA